MTPLERAARAICADYGVDPDRIVTAEDDAHIGLGLKQEHPAWTRYVPMVKAVLTAIRDPSEDMRSAGSEITRHVTPEESDEAYEGDAANIWRLMIDAALQED
ncbi:MAG: hypothetical protein ACSLE1_08305 [Sphingobium sp.]